MLKFFIDIEGTVLDDLKSRNFLTFNCSQIAKLIADRTKDNQDYRVFIYTWGWKTLSDIDNDLLLKILDAIKVGEEHYGRVYTKLDAIERVANSLWDNLLTLNLVNAPENIDELRERLLQPGAMAQYGYTKVSVAEDFAKSYKGRDHIILIDDLVTVTDEKHPHYELEVFNPSRLAIRIDNEIDPTVTLYSPDGQPIGEIKNSSALDNVRVQICKNHYTGFYFKFNGQKIHIDGNGNVEDWPKGCFDYGIQAAGELLCSAKSLNEQIEDYKRRKESNV